MESIRDCYAGISLWVKFGKTATKAREIILIAYRKNNCELH
jgi:hypothetical protein